MQKAEERSTMGRRGFITSAGLLGASILSPGCIFPSGNSLGQNSESRYSITDFSHDFERVEPRGRYTLDIDRVIGESVIDDYNATVGYTGDLPSQTRSVVKQVIGTHRTVSKALHTVAPLLNQ